MKDNISLHLTPTYMKVSAEFEFLLRCLKIEGGRDAPGRNPDRARMSINWARWQRLVIEHGVLAQVVGNMAANKNAGIPDEVRKELKALFYTNAARNTHMCNELDSLLKVMEKIGVDAIPFRGPILAAQAYDDCVCRSYADLDLLVRRRDFGCLYECMVGLGYTPCFPLDKGARTWWARFGREYVFWKDRFFLDVHFRAAGFTGLTEAAVSGAAGLTSAGRQVKTLPVEFAVLALCVNAAGDGWARLSFVVDLAHLIRNNRGLEWDSLLSKAKRMKAYTRLCIGLHLSSELLGLKIPGEISRDTIERAKVVRLAHRFMNNLQAGGKEVKKFTLRLLEIRSLDTWWAKFSYLCYYLFVPKISDIKAVPLPAFLFPIYLLLRPFLLFKRMLTNLIIDR